jgi:hypothetical protein
MKIGFIDLEQHGLGPWGIKVNLRDGETHSGNGSDSHGHGRADAASGHSHAALAANAVE